MDLVLHIGCEKTGAAALQIWLDQNSVGLAERSVFYCRALGRPDNPRIALYGIEVGRPDELLLAAGVKGPAGHTALKTRLKDELTAEVQAAKRRRVETFVISNEHLHSRCVKDFNVELIHDLLAPMFDSMRVVCFVRPQLDIAMAQATAMARAGGTLTPDWIDALMAPDSTYFDFDALLQRWAKCFGQERVLPVAYKRHTDVIGWFETLLGVADAALPRQKIEEDQLDYRTIALCNALALASPDSKPGEQARRLFAADLPVDQPLAIGLAAAQALQARYDAPNAAVCAAWHEIEPDDLAPDWSGHPEQGNIDRLSEVQAYGPFLRTIVDRYVSESWWHQARWAGAVAEREAMAARYDNGIRAAEFGLSAARNAARQEVYAEKCDRLVENLELRLIRLRRGKEREEKDMAEAEAQRLAEEAASGEV